MSSSRRLVMACAGSPLQLLSAVLEVPSAQVSPCSRSFRVILCRLSVMGAGCAKRATPDAVPACPPASTPAAPVVKLMMASADQDASGTINRQEFEKFVTPIGSWPTAFQKLVFWMADKDMDGELSAAEIEKGFQINMRAWPGLADTQWSPQDLKTFMSCCDSDGDGVISASELAEWHKLLDQNKDGSVSSEELANATDIALKKMAERLFKSGDENGDSVLDQAEFAKTLGTLGELSVTQVSHLFQRADANGDGSVSEEELRSLVNQLDSNGDGKLSPEELHQELAHSDTNGYVLSALNTLVPMLGDLAPAQAKLACSALVTLSGAYFSGGPMAAAYVAANIFGKKLVLPHAFKIIVRQIAQARAQPPIPQAQASAAAEAAAAPLAQTPQPDPIQPGPAYPGCFLCKTEDRGMRPLGCCDQLMCGQCIGRMITLRISTCPRCRQPWQI